MRIPILVASLVALATVGVVGCKDDTAARIAAEAAQFGYKGKDIDNYTSTNYIVTSAAVTNYVPERVLMVFEEYQYSENELKLLSDAGVVVPSSELTTLPEGFVKDSVEPWFVYWTKPITALGKNGVTGVLSHYNENKKIWEMGESYFSTYWATEEEAKLALDSFRQKLAAEYGVSRFYDIATGWVAEYVRLCLTGVVGQKADGRWSCMLNFRDKCKIGCGAWESVEEQQVRLNRYIYANEMKAWRKNLNEILQRNHESIMTKMKEASYAVSSMQLPKLSINREMRYEYSIYNEVTLETNDLAVAASNLWSGLTAQLKSFCGAELVGDVEKRFSGEESVYQAKAQSQFHDLNLAINTYLVRNSSTNENASSEATVTNAVGRWVLRLTEKLQDGVEIPPQPVLKQ